MPASVRIAAGPISRPVLNRRVRLSLITATLVSSLIAPTRLVAPTLADETYRLPSQPLVDIVDARPTPAVSFSPDHQWMLIMDRPGLPPIAEVAGPELRLAGVRMNPRTNGPSRGGYVTGLALKRIVDGADFRVDGLPAGARLSQVRWSPDARRIAFLVTGDGDITLWSAEIAAGGDGGAAAGDGGAPTVSGNAAPAGGGAAPAGGGTAPAITAHRVTDRPINAAWGYASYWWLPDSRTLACLTVPPGRGPEPRENGVPAGPVVQESGAKAAPAMTYQDLLSDAHDEALFEHYFTSQGALVTLDGNVRNVGGPAILLGLEPSPDGRYLLVQKLHRPWSYLVGADRFPTTTEILDAAGNLVKTVADVPLQESVTSSFDSAPTGPRSFEWRDDAPATLTWVEARDGGDAKTPAAVRDEMLALAAPFTKKPVSLITLGFRQANATWSSGDLALVTERWWKTRQTRTWIIHPDRPSTKPVLLWERSSEDRYSDPGRPAMQANAQGRPVLLTAGNGKELFLFGDGASEQGNRPFVDRLDLATKKAGRLWRSEAPYFERPIDLLDPSGGRVLTTRESPEEPPNFYIRDIASGQLTALTAFPHPLPFLKGIRKEIVHYNREDGVKLTGTLYLPPGYKDGDGPLPLVMWAYPQEFKSADAAGQVRESPYMFNSVNPSSAVVWVSVGYAVLDNPTMPIIGEGKAEPNDTYVKQLVMGAKAAADEMVRRGIAQPGRMAIGGHSYGAFTTANLLAHTDIFSAGIARSGAYNRTLTPFGFQSEERTLWEAPDVYATMSPFNQADKINEPLLLIHGMADNNPGTFPIQSERLFDALKGLGKTTRLVMLPGEAHGYRGRESVLDVLAESEQWLDKYVKNAPARAVNAPAE